MKIREKGGGGSGQGRADVVGLVETDRRGDSQETETNTRVMRDFFKPVAKRKKLGQREDLQPESGEIKFWASLKVPSHLDKILGVDLGSMGLVQGENLDDLQPELIHVPQGISNSEGKIDPTST